MGGKGESWKGSYLIHLGLLKLPHIRDPLDTVATDEDNHDDQADVGKPHVLLVDH